MSENQQQDNARIRFLLTNLGIIIIFILTLVVILAAYPSVLAPEPTLTPTATRRPSQTPSSTPSPIPTLTPTITRTRRHTFTPTITLTPSRTLTPAPSPTQAGPPTLTPARPVVGNANYSLHPWSVERANEVLALIEDYPNTLPRQSRGEDDANYYAAYYYPAIAHAEAILRYPDSPEANLWRWRRAYDLARMGDPQAGQAYADILVTALNRSEVNILELPEWFARQEPRLSLRFTRLSTMTGYLSTRLLEVKGPGSAFILLLETPSAYQARILASRFDFVKRPDYTSFAADLTADGLDEVVIFPLRPLAENTLELPQVFSLTQDPPEELHFQPVTSAFNVGMDYENTWAATPDPNGEAKLSFSATLFPACPVHLTRSYHWNGSFFEVVETTYQLDPASQTMSYCEIVVDQAAAVWGPDIGASFARQLLPDWPPAAQEDGQPYPPDALDEWRFRLASYQILAGEDTAARRQLNDIIASPAQPGSPWIELSHQLLAVYNNSSDLYHACLLSTFCTPRMALQKIIEAMPPGATDIQSRLIEYGVSLRSTGYFDFDGDGVKETWFTLRHQPGEKLEFWILAPYQQGTRAFYLDSIDTNLPDLTYYQEEPLPPIVLLNNFLAFRLERTPGSMIPYLTFPELPKFYPDRFRLGLVAAREALFAGASPEEVREQLVSLETNPGLMCRPFFACDEYYYLLGLASELAGKPFDAIDAYLRVWWDNSRSPFTTMVRLRVKGAAVLPSATPTLTQTGTLIPSLTPTVTGTLPTSTATQTPTITPTVTPYPTP